MDPITTTAVLGVGIPVVWLGGGKYFALGWKYLSDRVGPVIGRGWLRLNGRLPRNIIVTRQPDENDNFVLSFKDVFYHFDDKEHKFYYCNVKLKFNRKENIYLGEIDFLDWRERIDFEIYITLEGESEKRFNENNSDHKKVLGMLRGFAKVSADPSLTPNQKFTETIAVHKNILIDWWNYHINGLVAVQKIDPIGSQDEHLNEEKYRSALGTLAKQIDNANILAGYYIARERSLTQDLNDAEAELKKNEEDVRERELEQKKSKTIRLVIVVAAVLLALGVISAIIWGLPVLVSFITGFLGFVGSKIFAGIASIGYTALVTGIFVKFIPDVKNTLLEEARKDLKKSQEKVNSLTDRLKEVEKSLEEAKMSALRLAQQADQLRSKEQHPHLPAQPKPLSQATVSSTKPQQQHPFFRDQPPAGSGGKK